MTFKIEDFWKQKLPICALAGIKSVPGWSQINESLSTFVEAPLELSAITEDIAVEASEIILVSAPGAVGKSTLARQIAFETGNIYLDLAKAEPVGGNTLTGGIVKSGAYEKWLEGKISILIDGLDEARLKVSADSFDAFLKDVIDCAKGRGVPTVLFGRTGAVEEAWQIIADVYQNVPMLEIGFYDPERALSFAKAHLKEKRKESDYRKAEFQALELLLSGLRDQTEEDGDRFAGYAPVLQAVAEHVIAERNAQSIVSRIESGQTPITFPKIVYEILDREHEKIQTIEFDDVTLKQKLYLREEQLDRLAAQLLGATPPVIEGLGPRDAERYQEALRTWVDEHPFLDGGNRPSSSVFEAAIIAWALDKTNTKDIALNRELLKGTAANPFLLNFYVEGEVGTGKRRHVPLENVGVLYASTRSSLAINEFANLSVFGYEDGEEEESKLLASVDITIERNGGSSFPEYEFVTEQVGALRLGTHCEDIEIQTPNSDVVIGQGPECNLVAPISIYCRNLDIIGSRLVIDSHPKTTENFVYIEAQGYIGTTVSSILSSRTGDVEVSVVWPGSKLYPWTPFSADPAIIDDPEIDEALRRLRRFVTAFRSHSRGALARFQPKIEHSRMTKGSGRLVLDHLCREDIVSLQGSMYFLDSDALGRKVGVTYQNCLSYRFGEKAIAFVREAISFRGS